jgi:hypothetical protein
MPSKKIQLTHTQAIDMFYGGIRGLEKMKLPFKCKCGLTTYPEKDKALTMDLDTPVFHNLAVLTVPELFKHIRQIHKEFTIKK